MDVLIKFITDPATLTLFVLALLDLVAGSTKALRSGTWDWAVFGDWYNRNVQPYMLAYVGPWLVANYALVTTVPANYIPAISAALAIPGVAALATSIKRNIDQAITPIFPMIFPGDEATTPPPPPAV